MSIILYHNVILHSNYYFIITVKKSEDNNLLTFRIMNHNFPIITGLRMTEHCLIIEPCSSS